MSFISFRNKASKNIRQKQSSRICGKLNGKTILERIRSFVCLFLDKEQPNSFGMTFVMKSFFISPVYILYDLYIILFIIYVISCHFCVVLYRMFTKRQKLMKQSVLINRDLYLALLFLCKPYFNTSERE